MAELAGLLGKIYLSSGSSASFTTEAMTDSGNHLRYSITDTDLAYWDIDSAITVYVDGSPVTSGYSIEYAGGNIIFETSQGASTITVSGKYFTVAEVGGFYNYKVNIEKTMVDITTFGDTFKKVLPILGDWSATAERFYYDETFTDLVGSKLVCVFYMDEASAIRYEGYAYIKKNDINTPTTDVIKESLELVGESGIYFRD